MILFINACVRKGSRTKKLANGVLSHLNEQYEEVRLEDIAFPVVNEEFLYSRDKLIGEGRFDDPSFALARQFADADEIVIAAPFWDLSFPASLKQYFEQINVIGITFRYTAGRSAGGLVQSRETDLRHDRRRRIFPRRIRLRVRQGAGAEFLRYSRH